jgi:hypothetical protein
MSTPETMKNMSSSGISRSNQAITASRFSGA